MASRREVEAGQAVYSRAVLGIYDLWVLGVSNHWIWRCPTGQLRAHFEKHLSANHLDVGVGTGYFLDRCSATGRPKRLALMDLNPNSLAVAARRVARLRPTCYPANVLEPIQAEIDPFQSISINYLLHCLPGSMADKAVLFANLVPLLTRDGCLFGSTLLGSGVERNGAARRLMAFYNRKGIFSNLQDDPETLQASLEAVFGNVTVTIQGCAAIFSATGVK